jgi:peptidoglycan/xylan/chitin deacetylase (PgdA/CDA1 family)
VFFRSPPVTRPPIPILTYHQVEAPPLRGTPFRSLVVDPAAFARQLGMLKLLGYQGLCMGALQPYLRGEKTGKVVGITLDDGYVNNLTHALPVLARHGFTATCYVVSGQLGGSNVWDAGNGVPAKPLMDESQLKAWVAGGQEVGAHTRNHVDLRTLDAAAAREEITGCRDDLEQLLGVPVRHFCYPYGYYAPDHVGMARDAGYLSAVTTQRARSSAQDDLFELPRAPVLQSTSLPVLWMKVATGYEDRRRA